MSKHNLYREVCMIDIITPIQRMLDSGDFWFGEDGKIKLPSRILGNKPWLTMMQCPDRDCSTWHNVYFEFYQVIPLGCRNCWKVTFRPGTLSELFQVRQFCKELGLPGKCGIERRAHSGNKGGYGAFWYCPLDGGLKKARERRELIEAKLAHFLEKKVVVGLKRGCTEMEHFTRRMGWGGSLDWDKRAPIWNKIETLLNGNFVTVKESGIDQYRAPWSVDNQTVKLWIEHAVEYGDLTYLEFTGGEKILPEIDQYAGDWPSHRDYRSTWHGTDTDTSPGSSQGNEQPALIQAIPE